MGHEFGKTIQWANIFYEEQRHNTPMTAWLQVIRLTKKTSIRTLRNVFPWCFQQSISSSFP